MHHWGNTGMGEPQSNMSFQSSSQAPRIHCKVAVKKWCKPGRSVRNGGLGSSPMCKDSSDPVKCSLLMLLVLSFFSFHLIPG